MSSVDRGLIVMSGRAIVFLAVFAFLFLIPLDSSSKTVTICVKDPHNATVVTKSGITYGTKDKGVYDSISVQRTYVITYKTALIPVKKGGWSIVSATPSGVEPAKCTA